MALCIYIYIEKANTCLYEGHNVVKMEGQEAGGHHTAGQGQDRASHRARLCASIAEGIWTAGGGQEEMNLVLRNENHQTKVGGRMRKWRWWWEP